MAEPESRHIVPQPLQIDESDFNKGFSASISRIPNQDLDFGVFACHENDSALICNQHEWDVLNHITQMGRSGLVEGGFLCSQGVLVPWRIHTALNLFEGCFSNCRHVVSTPISPEMRKQILPVLAVSLTLRLICVQIVKAYEILPAEDFMLQGMRARLTPHRYEIFLNDRKTEARDFCATGLRLAHAGILDNELLTGVHSVLHHVLCMSDGTRPVGVPRPVSPVFCFKIVGHMSPALRDTSVAFCFRELSLHPADLVRCCAFCGLPEKPWQGHCTFCLSKPPASTKLSY